MPTEQKTQLHFSRFEFKYLLDAAQREEVESELQHFVELDPYVAERPDHRYFVRSLYYDDRELTAFHDKIDGMLTRRKFRVRTYSNEIGAAPWFLEIKGRHNNLVLKHRTPVEGAFDPHARGYDLSRLLLAHAAPSELRNEFEFQLYRRQIAPIVLVDYLRRPYISKFDPEFRLTFDAELTATRTDTMFPGPAVQSRLVLSGYTVMEVKFRHHLPSWFHRILQAHELGRRSISKICASTEALGIASDPN